MKAVVVCTKSKINCLMFFLLLFCGYSRKCTIFEVCTNVSHLPITNFKQKKWESLVKKHLQKYSNMEKCQSQMGKSRSLFSVIIFSHTLATFIQHIFVRLLLCPTAFQIPPLPWLCGQQRSVFPPTWLVLSGSITNFLLFFESKWIPPFFFFNSY